MLIAVILGSLKGGDDNDRKSNCGNTTSRMAMGILINATIVHFVLAKNIHVSNLAYTYLAKFILLYFLILYAVRTKRDFKILLFILVLGCSYIGYEVTINKRGRVRGNRLEGVGAPGAKGANQLASLVATNLPLAGALFMAARRPMEKVVLAGLTPLVLNVVILCNSRGAFLSLILSGFIFLFFSPLAVRKQTITLLALGVVACFMLLGDDRIIRRFLTTFAEEGERDSSAASRLRYWQAGLMVVSDYPLGSGGHGFKRVHARKYLAKMGEQYDARSVHNGYINEACEWGVQGFFLKMLFFLTAFWATGRAAEYQRSIGNTGPTIIRLGLISGTGAFLLTCMFGDFLDAEWGYWIVATMVAFAKLYGPPPPNEERQLIGDSTLESRRPETRAIGAIRNGVSPA